MYYGPPMVALTWNLIMFVYIKSNVPISMYYDLDGEPGSHAEICRGSDESKEVYRSISNRLEIRLVTQHKSHFLIQFTGKYFLWKWSNSFKLPSFQMSVYLRSFHVVITWVITFFNNLNKLNLYTTELFWGPGYVAQSRGRQRVKAIFEF